MLWKSQAKENFTNCICEVHKLANDNRVKDEKLQYYINREAEKISALSSGKIDKYEYLTGE